VKRILLLGMGPTASSALESLAGQFNVVGIVRPVQTGSETNDPVVRRAHKLSVPVLPDVSLAAVEHAIHKYQPHCTVVSSYDRVLTSDMLDYGKFVNVHYSALPKYRGRANVNWAILNGETETAITIHAVAPGLDNGNILFQQVIPIGPDDTARDIYDDLNSIQLAVLAHTISRYLDGYPGVPQDESEGTYGCSRVPTDGEIDWSKSTAHIYGLIRALSPPFPGAYSYLASRRITIARASPVPDGHRYVGRIPGRVVGRSRASGYADILTGDGILRVHEVTADDDSAPIPASTVITSTRQTLGLRSADLLSRIEELERRLAALCEK
jgi:methionyl-tRNA formyltransferase